MIIIRTAEDCARVQSATSDPQLRALLQTHLDRLAPYTFEELVVIAIAQPGDAPDCIPDLPLLDEKGVFKWPAELIARQGDWLEITFILSDDGFGLILLVPIASSGECP